MFSWVSTESWREASRSADNGLVDQVPAADTGGELPSYWLLASRLQTTSAGKGADLNKPFAFRGRHGIALLGILLTAAFLRPPVTVVGPLLPEIGDNLQLSANWLSLLGAIPVIGFGVGAFITPAIARRWDSRRLLQGVVLALLAALVWRSTGGTLGLFAATCIVGLAIAVGNTILPSIVRQDFADRIGQITGMYTTVMAGFAGLAAWVAVPLAGEDGGDWRIALAAPAAIGLVAMASLLLPAGHTPNRDTQERHLGALLRSPEAWQVTAYMGFQSIGFYAVITWLPTLLQDNGFEPATAGAMLSFTSTIGIPLGLALPWLLRISGSLAKPAVGAGIVAVIGTTGLAFAPTTGTWIWLTLMGVSQGLAFPVALAAISGRGADPATTTSLSAMAQGFGYLIAAVGTFLTGLIFAATNGWLWPTLGLAAFAAVQTWLGWVAGHPRDITVADR